MPFPLFLITTGIQPVIYYNNLDVPIGSDFCGYVLVFQLYTESRNSHILLSVSKD